MVKKENFNYGCALLRTLMCFEVVCCHFWEMNNAVFLQPFWMLRNYAVPVFMFMSFFFSGNLYRDNAGQFISRRIWRLALPLLGWSAIYFVVYYALGIHNTNAISELFWQIATGHSAKLNPAMWYQCVLIWLTIVFFVICKYAKGRFLNAICIGLVLASLIMQYSGLNLALFNDLAYELKYPLGRFVEMIPYACFGILLREYPKWIERCQYKWIVSLACAGWAVAFCCFNYIFPAAPGFQYSGIFSLGFAVTVVLFVYTLPVGDLSAAFKRNILLVSRYTLGIYCMHNLVGKLLTAALNKFGVIYDGFLICVVIYILCYGVAWGISKIPNRHLRMLVS